jgi:hypothetical protein
MGLITFEEKCVLFLGFLLIEHNKNAVKNFFAIKEGNRYCDCSSIKSPTNTNDCE